MPERITSILVANRGEIAGRVIGACREMGIRAAAVYSEADRYAPYLSRADSAHYIGPAASAESYLNIERILQAAQAARVDAIHPGYGFLSENPDFAAACEKAGFRFVGPPSRVIRAMGDKIAAKRVMEDAGVPVVPGYFGEDQGDARLAKEADSIGFPLMIKAAGGGGGRGMRTVESADAFASALDEARREAEVGFGDARVLLERYIARPRHVEFQIFGDAQGNVVHFFERECSIQRRHQKIIEESPSPLLTPELRARMAEAAVSAGKASGYVNAGTVEFLVQEQPDGDHQFYFLEVNTRLQVEHPVTEMTAGVDLVALQLQVAGGEPIPFPQGEIRASGHAIEARIYSEDPETGFLPSVGRLEEWIPPSGPGIRVESGVERGTEITPFYDPMLAKLIVLAADRPAALARMENALKGFYVLGIRTNIPYLLDIISDPDFRAGRIHTGFLADRFASWHPSSEVPREVLVALAAVSAETNGASPAPEAPANVDTFSPWRNQGAWRN